MHIFRNCTYLEIVYMVLKYLPNISECDEIPANFCVTNSSQPIVDNQQASFSLYEKLLQSLFRYTFIGKSLL